MITGGPHLNNELLYILQTIVGLIIVLVAFRMGRNWLYGLIAAFIILANIFVTKRFELFGLEATGGNVVYGAIFLITDLLSEYYGKPAARKGVLIGFVSVTIYLIMSQLILQYTPSEGDVGAPALQTIFSFAPSIVFGSLVAYFISQLHDVWAFHYWKTLFKGKHLWLRNNLSTLVSQLLDSVTFSIFAFLIFPTWFKTVEFILPLDVIFEIIITTYLLKVFVAVIDTPFIYLSRRFRPDDLRAESATVLS